MSDTTMTQPSAAARRHAPRTTPGYVVVLATALACLPILAVCQFANLARIDDIDAVFFAYYGKRLLAGQKLYVDLWDNKPPGIYWIDAVGLWISQGKFWGIALVVTLATVGSTTMFFLIARRLYGLAAAGVGTVMAALYINFYYYHVGANRPSTFYVLLELCTLWFYLRSYDAGRSPFRSRLGAGVCAGAAMCFRQTAFSAAAAILVHQIYLVIARRRSWSDGLRTLAPCVAGGMTVFAAVVVILWWTSDLGWAWHGAIASNLGYVTESRQSRIVPAEVFHWDDHVRVLGLPGVLALAAVIHAVATRIYVGTRKAENDALGGPDSVLALLLAWVPIGGYLALIGPHRAHHYYGIALPPLCLLATYGVWLLMRRDPSSRAPRFYVILAVLWFMYMAIPVGKLEVLCALQARFQRFDDRSGDRWERTVEAIERYTDPTDPVYSMRYLPFVFWRTNRPQAHRYLLDTLIDQWDARAQPYVDEVIEDLKASPPAAIIAGVSDLREMETPRTSISYRDLADWLRAHYTLVETPPKSAVWVRNK